MQSINTYTFSPKYESESGFYTDTIFTNRDAEVFLDADNRELYKRELLMRQQEWMSQFVGFLQD